MKVSSLFESGKTILSFEVFPPKKTSNIDTIYNTLEDLCKCNPAFISVTYGAGGSGVNGNKTCEIASIIKNRYDVESVAHLTCVNSLKEDIDRELLLLKENGIENILALRGDINPQYERKYDFLYASDLVKYIKEKEPNFDVLGACYPEGHLEAEDIISDIKNLKNKVDLGVSHLVSQLFFDNTLFYRFLDMIKLAGIDVPVEAGIMPVTSKSQIERMVTMCGASLPHKFSKALAKYENNPAALRDAGIAYAVDQIVDLVSNGVDGIHLYTMNNPYVATKITEAVKNLL